MHPDCSKVQNDSQGWYRTVALYLRLGCHLVRFGPVYHGDSVPLEEGGLIFGQPHFRCSTRHPEDGEVEERLGIVSLVETEHVHPVQVALEGQKNMSTVYFPHSFFERAVDEWGNELFPMFLKLGVKKYEK